MRLRNRQEICTLIFEGVINRVIIGQEENGEWKMFYLGANGAVNAQLSEGRSREHILAKTKECMIGHGKALIENLIEDSERYLGSMNLQPTTTTDEEAGGETK